MFVRRSRLKAQPNLQLSKRNGPSVLPRPRATPNSDSNSTEKDKSDPPGTTQTSVEPSVKNNITFKSPCPNIVREITEPRNSSDVLPSDFKACSGGRVDAAGTGAPEPIAATEAPVHKIVTEPLESAQASSVDIQRVETKAQASMGDTQCVETKAQASSVDIQCVETKAHASSVDIEQVETKENKNVEYAQCKLDSLSPGSVAVSSKDFNQGVCQKQGADNVEAEGEILKHILLNKKDNDLAHSLDKNTSCSSAPFSGRQVSDSVVKTSEKCNTESEPRVSNEVSERGTGSKNCLPGNMESPDSNESGYASEGQKELMVTEEAKRESFQQLNPGRSDTVAEYDSSSSAVGRVDSQSNLGKEIGEGLKSCEQITLSKKNHLLAHSRTLKEVNHLKEGPLVHADEDIVLSDEGGARCLPGANVPPTRVDDCATAKKPLECVGEDVKANLKELAETTSINKENVFSDAQRRVTEQSLDLGSPAKSTSEPQSPVKMFKNRFTHIMPNLKRTHRMSVSEDEETAGQPVRKAARRTNDTVASKAKPPKEDPPFKESRITFPPIKEPPRQQSNWKEGKIKAQTSAAKDPQNLTMRDFIYYNPTSNPMPKKDEGAATDSTSAINLDEEVDDPDMEDEDEAALPVPQVTIGPDNQIIIDKSSLVVDSDAMKKAKQLKDTPVLKATPQSYRSKRNRSKDWTFKENQKFFEQLCVHGSDFSIISGAFTEEKRTRSDIMKKFKKEERANASLVDFVLGHSTTVEEKRATVEAYFAKLALTLKKPAARPRKGRKKADIDCARSEKKRPTPKKTVSMKNAKDGPDSQAIKALKEEYPEQNVSPKEFEIDVIDDYDSLPFGLSDRKDIVDSIKNKNAEEMEYKIVYGPRKTTRSGRASKPRRLSVEIIEEEKRSRFRRQNRRCRLPQQIDENSVDASTNDVVLKKIAYLQRELDECKMQLLRSNGRGGSDDAGSSRGPAGQQNMANNYSFPPGTIICVPMPDKGAGITDRCPMQVFVVNQDCQGFVKQPSTAPSMNFYQPPVQEQQPVEPVNERTPVYLQMVQPAPVEGSFQPVESVVPSRTGFYSEQPRTSAENLSGGLTIGSEVTITRIPNEQEILCSGEAAVAEDVLVPETLKENLKDVMEESYTSSLGRPRPDFISSVNNASHYLLELSRPEDVEDSNQPQDLTMGRSVDCATEPLDCSQASSSASTSHQNGTQCQIEITYPSQAQAQSSSNANQDEQYKGEDLRKVPPSEASDQRSVFKDEGTQSDFVYDNC